MRSFYFHPPDARGGEVVGAHVHVPELWPLVDSLYAAYRCDPHPKTELSSEITLWSDSGTFWLRGPSGDWYADSPGEALAYFEAELTDSLLARADRWVGLHGSAVAIDAGPIALLGPSGSGKSTLSLGLCQTHGLTLLTDDALLLDPVTGAVQPFERSLRVHRTGLARLDLDPARLPGARIVEPYVWIRPDEYAGAGRNPGPLLALIFLGSREGGVTGLQPLSPADSLKRLLVARAREDADPEEELDALLALSRSAPAFSLNVVDLHDCVNRVYELAMRRRRQERQSGAPAP